MFAAKSREICHGKEPIAPGLMLQICFLQNLSLNEKYPRCPTLGNVGTLSDLSVEYTIHLFGVASLFRAHDSNFPKQSIIFVIGARSEEKLIKQPGSPAAKAERPNIFDKQRSAVRVQKPSLMPSCDCVEGLNVSAAKVPDQDAVAEGTKVRWA